MPVPVRDRRSWSCRTAAGRNDRPLTGPRAGAAEAALLLEAQGDTDLFNKILLTLCRTLKHDKSPLSGPYDGACGQVLQLMVTESTVSTLQSFDSVMTQPYPLPHMSKPTLDQVAVALEVS